MSTAKSTAERVKLHRANKAAEAFSDKYLGGANFVKPKTFIKGKEDEFCHGTIVSSVFFDDKFRDSFIDHLLDEYNAIGNSYNIFNLAIAWKYSVKHYLT